MTKCLLIGGDHDGEFIDVNTENRKWIEMPSKVGPASLMTDSYKVELYERQVLHDGKKEHFVYVNGSLNVITELIAGYKKPNLTSDTIDDLLDTCLIWKHAEAEADREAKLMYPSDGEKCHAVAAKLTMRKYLERVTPPRKSV